MTVIGDRKTEREREMGRQTGAVFASAVDFISSMTDTSEARNEVLTRSIATDVRNQSTLVDV